MLTNQFNGRVVSHPPRRRLALWVRFDMDLDRLAAAAAGNGVTILPASAFTTVPRSVDAARLGFASLNVSELRRATDPLKAATAS